MARGSSGSARRLIGASILPALFAGGSSRLKDYWKNSRSFLVEILIIVVGVLIALGAEQIVSDWQDRAASAEARATIRAELAENLGRMKQRDGIRACIAARLEEVADYLERAGTGKSQVPFKWVGRPQTWPMLDSRWTAAASAGRASLLSADEQAVFGAIYANMRDFQNTQAGEQTAWAQLRGMAGLATISPQQDAILREALQNARYAAWLTNVIVMQATSDAAQAGIRPKTSLVGSRSVCIPTNTPFDSALRQTGASALGEPR